MTLQPGTERSHSGLPPLPEASVSSAGAMASVLLLLVLAVLDSSALQIALPRMVQDLQVSPAISVWILISFQLALVACLLLFSTLADCLGYRNVFLAGSVVFVGASLLCTISRDIYEICGARTIQGVGAAAIYSTNPSLVRLIYPGERLRRGIALAGMSNALALALGPATGAFMMYLGSWRLIFLINLPLGLLGLMLGLKYLPSSKVQELVSFRVSFDVLSQLLGLIFLPFVVMGCGRLSHDPASGTTLLALGIVAGVYLFRRQGLLPYPMLPVELFRQPAFTLSLACSVFGFMALTAAYTALPFIFTLNRATAVGLAATYLVVPPIMTAMGNALVVPLSRYLNEIRLCSLGMTAMALGLIGLVFNYGLWFLLSALILLGLGFGLFQTPNNRMILGVSSPGRSGNVSGTLAVARTLGQTSGTTTVSLTLAVWGLDGSTGALIIAATAALICSGLGLLRLPSLRV